MTDKTPLPILIDSTMISCWRQCQTKFYYEFMRGYRPAAFSIDLHAGACFATALECVYTETFLNGKPLEEALAKAHALFMEEWGDAEPPEGNQRKKAKNKDRVWEAVEYYFQLWPPEKDPIQPYHIEGKPTLEFRFAVPLDFPGFPKHPSGDPFVYGGRFDMLGTLANRTVIKDDKTTSGSIGKDWADQWNLRSQFIGYKWAANHCGIQTDTVVARGLSFQMTQFPTAEAEKTYTDYIVDKWLEQLRRDLHSLVKAWNEDHFEVNFADACTQYGMCPFMNVCMSSTPESWCQTYDVAHWNPLLKNPIGEAA